MLSSPGSASTPAFETHADSIGILMDASATESQLHMQLAGLMSRSSDRFSDPDDYSRFVLTIGVADSSSAYWNTSIEDWLNNECARIIDGCAGLSGPQMALWALVIRAAAIDAVGGGVCALNAPEGDRVRQGANCAAASTLAYALGRRG